MCKTLTFALMHFIVALSVTYLMTGSIVLGGAIALGAIALGAIALIEPTINTVAFYVHEKLWQRHERHHTGPQTGSLTVIPPMRDIIRA